MSRTIFWCGNCGSMADARPAAELVGNESVRQPLKSIALGHDNAILTLLTIMIMRSFSRQL